MVHPELNNRRCRFLVTGGAGFIGSNLALELLASGQDVVILDNMATGRIENIEELKAFAGKDGTEGTLRFIEGDMRDLAVCREAVEGVDYIFHNAALGSVPRSVEDPVTSNDVNVAGMVNLLTSAKDAAVKRFIYASSSAVYGDSVELPKVEGSEGNPLSPYAVTKVVCELYAEVFERTYGLQVIGLRYFNVFGPRQDTESAYAAVIPIFVSSLLKGKAPKIHGDGETSRDFTYIDNVVDANIRSAFCAPEATGRAYNIACAGRVTLNELYGKIATLLGKEDLKATYGPERVGDVRHSFADISCAEKFLGYTPKVDFKEGLDLCIDWYKEHLA